jgi:dUTPase
MDATTNAILEICVDEDYPELLELYERAVIEHNNNVQCDPFANSGFDLITPDDTIFTDPFTTKMMDLHIKTQMWGGESDEYNKPSAFYVYPRSSISKTQLMLSNHVGIIDSGYRNNLMCAFRYMIPFSVPPPTTLTYTVVKHTRLTQICHPSLRPFRVKLIKKEDLTTTTRKGGFGSTGGTV